MKVQLIQSTNKQNIWSKKKETGEMWECKPLEESAKSVQRPEQHFHYTCLQLQQHEKGKCDHHHPCQNDKIVHNSLLGQKIVAPVQHISNING